MPRITLTQSTTSGNIPVHVETSHVIHFRESLAKNRPGTYLLFPTNIGLENPLFVEETYPEILEKEKAAS